MLHKARPFLLLVWVVCSTALGAPSTGEHKWKDLPPDLAKGILESAPENVIHDADSAENYVYGKRMPPLPFDKRMPPLPFDKRMPPLPFDKRMPPLPFDKRLPNDMPFFKRMPPLPFDKRMPPLPFDKRLVAERKRKALLENGVDFDSKSDELTEEEKEELGDLYNPGKSNDAQALFEKRMPPLPFDKREYGSKRMPPLPFDKRAASRWVRSQLKALEAGRSKRTAGSDPISYARAKSAITA